MDAVSDVLRAVRLSGAVYLNGEFTEPWCVIGQGNAALYGAFLPLSERVVSYHLIIEGHCCAQLAGNQGSAIHLNAGELLVVPQGEAHIIGSDLALSPESAAPLLASQLQSAPGQGATFTVTLVTAVTEAPAAAAAALAEDADARTGYALSILVADDHEINRRALSLMLEPLEAAVVLAGSGGEALSLLAQRPFDLVLMDVHMPDMSGQEATRRLRLAAGPNRRTPVIAVTGAVEDSDVKACLDAGMNDWVAKPIDAGQLYNALARQLEGKDGADAAVA